MATSALWWPVRFGDPELRLEDLEKTYRRLREDPDFQAEFDYDLAHYVGRPSPLYHAERWSKQLGGAQIWLKREDLNHTGATR